MSDHPTSDARPEGVKAGATAERERTKAVTASEHYAGREAAALLMLSTTDMTAVEVCDVLSALPAASAAHGSTLASRGGTGLWGITVVQQQSTLSINSSEIYTSRQQATR